MAPSNLDAAITLRSAETQLQNTRRLQLLYTEKTQGLLLRLSPQIKPHATFMQPLQCVLKAKIPKHHVTVMRKNRQKTSKQPLPCGLLRALAEPSLHPLHNTRYLSSPAAATLHGKTQLVWCSGFLPKSSPMQHSCSHFMISTLRLPFLSIFSHLLCDVNSHHPALSIVSHF